MRLSRREFISTIAVAGASIPFTSKIESLISGSAESKFPVSRS
ncbi:MAG TPA: twin-arginine translocation signal domain-containing protein [Bacteroidales bacterium]|nr:twin-arginine translocation signal domain-containing protein [Bacteroidales bacterium]